MHACMHACMHVYIPVCTNCTDMPRYIHKYISTSMHACIHTCMHACIYIYIHTHININSLIGMMWSLSSSTGCRGLLRFPGLLAPHMLWGFEGAVKRNTDQRQKDKQSLFGKADVYPCSDFGTTRFKSPAMPLASSCKKR